MKIEITGPDKDSIVADIIEYAKDRIERGLKQIKFTVKADSGEEAAPYSNDSTVAVGIHCVQPCPECGQETPWKMREDGKTLHMTDCPLILKKEKAVSAKDIRAGRLTGSQQPSPYSDPDRILKVGLFILRNGKWVEQSYYPSDVTGDGRIGEIDKIGSMFGEIAPGVFIEQ